MRKNCDHIFAVCPSGMCDELCISCRQGRRIAELEEALGKAGRLSEYDNWPIRHPLVYGCMAKALEGKR
jgi:hypothetical protein